MAVRLTARKVETAKPGKYSDGGNLYLVVSPTGSRKWVLRFTWRGQAKEMGLGSAASVPLSDAREKAAAARRTIAGGINPIAERNVAVVFQRSASSPTRWSIPVERVSEPKHTRSGNDPCDLCSAAWNKPVDTISTE